MATILPEAFQISLIPVASALHPKKVRVQRVELVLTRTRSCTRLAVSLDETKRCPVQSCKSEWMLDMI